jgi:hypothetical protein
MMLGSKWSLNKSFAVLFVLLAGLLWPANSPSANAQEGNASWLFLSEADAASAPTITLRVFGVDPQGAPLNLTPADLNVTNNGLGINNLTSGGPEAVGTFTVFVVDVPIGVQDQFPAIQQAIEQYASPPNMQEQLDYIAVYKVGETGAVQLLEPTNFYNSVRNFFAAPLEPEGGPTALIDSMVGLLNGINELKPNPNMYTSLVVMTDGTDVVSTQFEEQDILAQANAARVPIHTVTVLNANLQPGTQEAGRTFLAGIAAGSRGISGTLEDPAGVQAIWDRIAAFRNHSLFQYTVENLTAGEQQVVVALANEPAVQVQAAVDVSAAAPSVVLNVPEESRTLTLSDLSTPVQLSFSASTSWLDGIDRQLTNAELIVNGTPVQSVDVNELDRFTVQIGNFVYGANTVQLAVTDEQGQLATSPAVTLTVNEGETSVPEDIQGGTSSNILRIVIGCFVVLLVLVLLAFLAVITRRWRILQRLGLAGALSRIPFLRPYLEDAREVQSYGRQGEQYQREFQQYSRDSGQDGWEQPGYNQPQDYGRQEDWPEANVRNQPQDPGRTPWPAVQKPQRSHSSAPYLEVLESVTRMPSLLDLTAVEHRIGRSPAQADIVFENDITVSRLHASIVLENDVYRIYDEGSTSGTWVNEQAITNKGHTLKDGDEIRLGAAVLRYRLP